MKASFNRDSPESARAAKALSHEWIAASASVLLALLLAPVPGWSAEDGETNKQARLAFLKQTLAEHTLETADESATTLELAEEPAIWYTNPVRSAHGTGATFFWLNGSRPIAAVSLSIRDEGRLFRELTMLDDVPLTATRDGQPIWSPRKPGTTWASLPEAPHPGDSESIRLLQMRSMSRRFQGRLIKDQLEGGSLRVLSKPLHRYQDAEAGIIDGAVFALVEATDPEILLSFEARSNESGGAWHYRLARMTSRPSEVTLDGKLHWSTAAYWQNPRSPADPYIEGRAGTYEEP
ncbi:MAG: hypothetical protein O3C40_26720 [Planctomycetota bacterium]|nr:hypothetical protein [Planctomycetota bacterium]